METDLKKLLNYLVVFGLLILFINCSGANDNDDNPPPVDQPKEHTLTIFHINDQHGRLANFAKIKHIADLERQKNDVILVCGGDMFSGNPVVDNHSDKGYPMIDLMNKVGFDVAVLGNHEFDYGEEVLKRRLEQANFQWVCANVDMGTTGVPEPHNYTTLAYENFKITFLGLVETNGKEGDVIPLTHPWKVENLSFERYQDVIEQYGNLKEKEDADLYVALTHLGESVDYSIASTYGYFDLIVGGHSHTTTNATVNGIPIIQAGSNLNYLGKATIKIKEGQITGFDHSLIDLNTYNSVDSEIETLVSDYNDQSGLDDVIGYSEGFHARHQVGCFYTDALRIQMGADISFQNTGGIRNSLDEGDITKRDVFTFDPFNNGSVIYTMKVSDIRRFLMETLTGVYVSGIELIQEDGSIVFLDGNSNELDDEELLTIAINDYIPAVHESYFTSTPDRKSLTTAETIIAFLESHSDPIDYTQSTCYFKYGQ